MPFVNNVTAQDSKTWLVDSQGQGDFTTIQDAVNTAQAGDTVKVNPGTYDEHVVVNKGLTLVGKVKAEASLMEAATM